MAATPEGRGGHIDGDPRQTGPTIAIVIVTPAVAMPFDVRVARISKPKAVIRQFHSCPAQHRRGLFPCANDQERGLFQYF